MNATRWLLVLPLLLCLVCLGMGTLLALEAKRSHPVSIVTGKYIDWHKKKVASEDLPILREHADKLWGMLILTDAVYIKYVGALHAGFSVMIWVPLVVFLFCAAAFYAAGKGGAKKT